MNILDDIIEHKRDEVAKRKQHRSVSSFADQEYFHRQTISLRQSLQAQRHFGIIAEIKRSSPSAGSIRKNADPQSIARDFFENGASGISVLTDERFFSGTLEDLTTVRRAVQIPILRKDFIIDEYQLSEAKAAGADAVLLIATMLEQSHLSELFAAAVEIGLECLVELYEKKEIDILDVERMRLVGINNRNLRTFTVDLQHSVSLARSLPADVTIVSESGISGPADIHTLRKAGIHAALIGEHLMKSAQPGKALKMLLESGTDETSR